MGNKVLFCASVDYHFKAFHIPYLKWFKEQGWEVHVAAKGDIDIPCIDEKFQIPIQRSPFKKENIKAYQELKTIINKNQYQIIHCHTPLAGVLTRIASRKTRKKGTKVIYTAHGFHFCKGAPVLNWMIYYPIEKLLAPLTDCLITINEEDYNLAKRRLNANEIEHVYGVGVDTSLFAPVTFKRKNELRESFGYHPDDFLMFYAAEFNKNKNQKFLIKALSLIKDQAPHARLLLAGEGSLLEKCKKLASELEVEHMVHFLGFRTDIDSLLPMCDIAVASSLREGLPVNIMEAMACGLPVIATENRGHRELIQQNYNGLIVKGNCLEEMGIMMKMLMADQAMLTAFGECGREMMERKYSVKNVLNQKSNIYMEFMREMEDLQWALQ